MIRVHVISTISWRSVFQLTGAEKILGLSWDKQDQILILLKDKIQVGGTLGLSWDKQDQILILLKDTIQVYPGISRIKYSSFSRIKSR